MKYADDSKYSRVNLFSFTMKKEIFFTFREKCKKYFMLKSTAITLQVWMATLRISFETRPFLSRG